MGFGLSGAQHKHGEERLAQKEAQPVRDQYWRQTSASPVRAGIAGSVEWQTMMKYLPWRATWLI